MARYVKCLKALYRRIGIIGLRSIFELSLVIYLTCWQAARFNRQKKNGIAGLVGCGLHHHLMGETILHRKRNSPVAKQARINLNSNEKPIAWVPATIAAVIAIAGTAGLMFDVLASEQIPEDRGAGMRSAAAAYLAGATITPTGPASDVGPR